MRGIFPETRKRWTDGLDFGIEDTRSHYEQMYWCFGGGGGDGGGGADLSDEDIDQDLQQDIAAAASGLTSQNSNFDFSPGFDPGDRDTKAAIDATRSISQAASGGQEAVDAAQAAAAANPGLQQAVANLTGTPVGFASPQSPSAPASGKTFGVDGRSITGSTELDAKLGYTDGVGTGKKGVNFDALNAATAEQLAAAKNTAAQMGDDSGSSAAVKSAVSNVLSNYEVGDITNAGNFADKGRKKSQVTIQEALNPQAAQQQISSAVSDILGADVTQPEFTGLPYQRGIVAPTTGIGARPSASIAATPGVLPASRRAAVSQLLSGVPTNVLRRDERGRRAAGVPSLGQNLIQDELRTRSLAQGDAELMAMPTAEVEALAEDILGSRLSGPAAPSTPAEQQAALNAVSGILSTPQATAANILGTPAAMQDRIQQRTDIRNDLISQGVDPALAGIQADQQMNQATVQTAPATSTTAPVANLSAPGQLTAEQLANLDQFGVDDEAGAMGMRGPGSGYTAGLPDNLTFNADGFTTNLAGTTAAQRAAMPGYMNTMDEQGNVRPGFVAGATDFVFGNPLDTAYGYEIPGYQSGNPNMDPTVTGIVGKRNLPGMLGAGIDILEKTFMDPPETTEDLLNRGVYTGFGPASQPGSDQGSGDGPTQSKAPNDPCPAGYQMVNGACTPMDDVTGAGTGAGGPGSNFVINPTTGLPTLFTPATQATPVGGVNPFMLQPYTPGQAATIGTSRLAQGIQALSPTGAALGKQI